MRVSETLDLSWPTRPAEWNVEPLVSSLRSSSTTSRSPSLARWWAIEAPPTPPPMMTTAARSGSSRGLTIRFSLHARVGCGDCGEPFLQLWLLGGRVQALEVLARVAREVEVDLRDLRLHAAPCGLARVGRGARQREARAVGVGGGPVVVGVQQSLVGGLVEVVVDGEV